MSCRIIRNPDTDRIERVLAPNGKDSILFNQLVNIYGDEEIAVKKWLESQVVGVKNNPHINRDENGEPMLSYHDGEFDYVLENELFMEDEEEEADDYEDEDRQKFNRFFKNNLDFLIDSYKIRLRVLNKKLANLVKLRKESESDDELMELSKQIVSYKQKVANIEQIVNNMEGPRTKFMYHDITLLEIISKQELKEANRILQDPNSDISDYLYADSIIKTHLKLADFSPGKPHPIIKDEVLHEMIDEDSLTYKTVGKMFVDNGNTATLLERRLHNIYKEYLQNKLKDDFNLSDKEASLNDFIRDINRLEASALDISEYGIALLDAMHAWNKQANFEAKEKAVKIFEEIKDLIENLEKSGFTEKQAYDMISQIADNDPDKKTGNLVSMFSFEYYQELKRVTPDKNKNDKRQWSYYAYWLDTNVNLIDVQRLADGDTKYFEELKNEVGEFIATRFLNKAKEINDDYVLEYQIYEEYLRDSHTTVTKKGVEVDEDAIKKGMQEWDKQNNPVLLYDYIKNERPVFRDGVPTGKDMIFNDDMILFFPRNTKTELRKVDGVYKEFEVETDYFDEKYKALSLPENKAVKEFYDYTIALLQDLYDILPAHKVKDIDFSTIPFIEKDIFDNFAEAGLLDNLSVFSDQMKTALTTQNTDETDLNERDENGEAVHEIQIRYIKNLKPAIMNYVKVEMDKPENRELKKRKDKEYYDKIAELEKEAIVKLSEKKSYDLGKTMMAFSLWALSYDYKARIEDSMRIAQRVVNGALEQEINSLGENVKNRFGNLIGKEGGPKRMKEALDHFMKSFYGKKLKKDQGVVKTNLDVDYTFTELSDEEFFNFSDEDLFNTYVSGNGTNLLTKNDKEKIVERIKIYRADYHDTKLANKDPEAYTERLMRHQDKLSQMGKGIVSSQIGDQMLKFVQLKGMGWNLFSAFANLGFAFISSSIQAADGRIYTEKDYFKAWRIMMSSAAKNYSFHLYENELAKKVNILMSKMDVLKTSKYELMTKRNESTLYNKYKKRVKFLSPYNPQMRSEYFVQGADMVAVLLAHKVKVNGEVISLWDAIDNEGNLIEGVEYFSRTDTNKQRPIEDRQKILNDIKLVIDKVIKMNHGNYDPDSPIFLKTGFWGRAFTQFRTWMFQGVESRFGREKRDIQLNITKKGYYQTLVKYGVGNATNGSGVSIYAHLLANFQHLLNKTLMLKVTKPTSYEELGLSEVDAANMRRVMRELAFVIQLFALTTVLGMLKGEEDDDKTGFTSRAVNSLLNLSARLTTDIRFYTSPGQFENMSKNMFPFFTIYKDAVNLLDGFVAQFGESPDFENGYYKGQNKLLVRTGQAVPMFSNIYKLGPWTAQTLGNN